MALDPQLMSVVGTAAVGWTMVATGRKKRMLETKKRARRCPSCGHIIEGRTCDPRLTRLAVSRRLHQLDRLGDRLLAAPTSVTCPSLRPGRGSLP